MLVLLKYCSTSEGMAMFEPSTLMSEVFARKKYSLLRPPLLLLVPPRPTTISSPNDMMLKAIGVNIHANLPAFPMAVVVATNAVKIGRRLG